VSESLVTVASYWFVSDAMLAQNALEAAGIESVLDDQNMALNYANAVHGVKLRVRNVDALRAGEVLESSCEALEEIGEADEERDETNTCPACGATEVIQNARGLLFAVIAALAIGILGATSFGGPATFYILIAAAILLLISDRRRCAECGETWN
jgi:hypothetical protein